MLPTEDYCYHTGVKFIDAEMEFPNPNHPRKRTLDHIIPLSVCFMRGMTPVEANHPDNLCWTLKCVNNVRGATSAENFKETAEWFREKFREEGVEVNDNTIVQV